MSLVILMFCVSPRAFASETIGRASDIGPGNAVYFGSYPQTDLGFYLPSEGQSGQDWVSALYENNDVSLTCYYSIDPIKWRVLQTAGDSSFLLSEKNLDAKACNPDWGPAQWETNAMRAWLNGYAAGEAGQSAANPESDSFIGRAFNQSEGDAIRKTSLTNADNPDHGTPGGNSTADRLFLLSVEEINAAEYGFASNAGRVALNTGYTERVNMMSGPGEADTWWLRSPGQYDSNVAYVGSNGQVNANGFSSTFSSCAVRPAFKLNLSSVLFTSAAAGGKSELSNSLADNSQPSEIAELKLTILDPSQTLDVTATEEQSARIVSLPGDLNFGYSNAKTGTNQYVSCILEDSSGEVTHYGKLTDSSAAPAGALSIPLPVLREGTYTLKVFSEQANGDNLTDFAGNPATMTLTVSASGSDTTAAVSNFSGSVDEDGGSDNGGDSPDGGSDGGSDSGGDSPDGGTDSDSASGGDSSGGGCDAGTAGFALLPLAVGAVAAVRRKTR